jgi:uncharacterized protein with HEPN domain
VSPRDWQGRVQDILQAIEDVRQFMAGMSFEAFCADKKTVQAVAFSFAVIGEAGAGVAADVQARHPRVPWAKMRAMRNVMVHRYFGINLQILWETAQQDLPALEAALRALLEHEAQRETGD